MTQPENVFLGMKSTYLGILYKWWKKGLLLLQIYWREEGHVTDKKAQENIFIL